MSLAKFPLSAGILQRGIRSERAGREELDLRCPTCNSPDLKKLSLVWQEGRFAVNARSRIRGVVVGEGGPNIVTGKATTRGVHESEIAKRLAPPKKWSYLKLVLWSGVVTFVALIAYVRSVMSAPGPASTMPVTLYAVLFPLVFTFLVLLFWRHNTVVYAREYGQWDRSYLCQRCGSVSQHDLAGPPPTM